VTPSALVLADGSVFEGSAFGAPVDVSSGEVVFHTGLSGYQEVLSDPSYAGQIVTFTSSHLGNYGTAPDDVESRRGQTRGVVVREMSSIASSWRSTATLDAWLHHIGMAGICRVDTRRLTRVLRDHGSVNGAFGTAPLDVLRAAALAEPGTSGVDLVAQVSTRERYVVAGGPRRVVAFDFGIKKTILDCLVPFATVTVVPHTTTFEEVLELRPDGVFLSNGPGDPEDVVGAPGVIRSMLDADVPVFGICLGHQLLARALGGRTYKLPFGHHGANHPVRNLETGSVEITSQNHNFCVDVSSLEGLVEPTHVNLNDGTNEGMRVSGARACSVQFHPEAGPGPHDSRHLFGEFARLMEGQ